MSARSRFLKLAALGFALSLIAPIASAQNAAPGAPPSRDTRSKDPSAARPGEYVVDQDHTRIIWTVTHHGYSNFSAMLPIVTGGLTIDPKTLTGAKLDVTVQMDKVITGVPAAHFDPLLKGDRLLNVAKYPTARFVSTSVRPNGANKASVTGNMTFYGQTKPATLEVTFLQHGEGPNPGYRLGFDGTMTFKRSDFGFTALGPSVGDEVTLRIEAEFHPKT